MTKQIPTEIKNEEERLEIMGRYDITSETLAKIGSKVLAHCYKQTNADKNSIVTVLLYLNTPKESKKREEVDHP